MNIHNEMRKFASRKTRLVCFRVCDVFIPDAQRVLNDLFGEEVLKGKIVDYTNCAATDKAFAIVEVEEVSYFLIVPVERISVLENTD